MCFCSLNLFWHVTGIVKAHYAVEKCYNILAKTAKIFLCFFAVISLNDFSDLLEILVPVSGDWEVLLVALGVTGAKRDMIKAQRAHNPKLCLVDGLERWIVTDDSPTYEKIIKALSSKLVGWNILAEEVEMFANLKQKTKSTGGT